MRVQTEEWRRFIPGIRMYKGKLTYFYNGEKLYNDENEEYLIYNEEERQKWQVIMILPGVEIIPEGTFYECMNVETVIMNDSVKRVERYAFEDCSSLKFVRLSTTLEYIGDHAFNRCESLTSIFIPESCREIYDGAFLGCEKLIILSVPRNTTLGEYVIVDTALIKASPFETDRRGWYHDVNVEVNQWIKNFNQDEKYALHRACSAFNPISDIISEIIKR